MERPGFIAVYRKIQDHWLWEDKERFYAWMDILLSAQFHDSKVLIGGNTITVPRGSWFVSLKTLETRWSWSRNKTRTFIRTLVSNGMLTTKRTPKGMLLTVVNYEVYQNGGTSKGTSKSTPEGTAEGTSKGTSEGTSEGTHTNKGNKGNKVNKKKKTVSPEWTFERDEIERMLKEDPDNEEYFQAALKKRDEEGGSL